MNITERKLPLKEVKRKGKTVQILHVISLMMLLLLPTLGRANSASQKVASQDHKLDTKLLEQQLKRAVNQEIDNYSERHQWSNVTSQIKVKLPTAASSLPSCPTPLGFSSQDNQAQPIGRLKRQVKCESTPMNWQFNATIYVEITLPVLVAKTQINRNEMITSDMLSHQSIRLKSPKAIMTSTDQTIGLYTTRRVRQGQLITENLLKKLFLINKGDEVLIVAKKGEFEASTKGIALEHGKMNEQIKIQNKNSHKVISGRVFAQGKVETIF
ncbi:flagellar basal body P-ring formation chaperone FlgA [Photobacterium leiognathi]|uniref:flagellar basal body P-ring formation chaperone FlgA n=1 Tax=Photobacterium leiognathi TaxID=553611 RepID=UPI002980DE7F|nr:flagellar basal body P-ring formation chaperone FlgA [Photobacterium leiognathi]